MFDLSTKTPAQIIETPAPISMENLQKSFADDQLAFVIDYETSVLKGKQLLVYLSNLEIPCDIKISQNVTKEERFALIAEYMSFRNILGCASLALTVGTILTAAKDIDDFYHNVENPILNADEIIEFIMDNQIMVSKWVVFMDSMIVFTMLANQNYVKAFGSPAEKYENIDDDAAVGNNFIHLFDIPQFMELYFSVPGTRFYYFVKQFEDYMFAGQNLFFHFMKDTNPLPAIVEAMGSVEYETEDFLNQAIEQTERQFQE
ncbi:hypothetical protein D3C72_185980 [compost metagenome]